MAPRRPKNPINDIIDVTSAWLGGNRGSVNPQVERTISQTKEAGKVVDQFATGGMGAALVSDAQRMAVTGSNHPWALYKTAAVNAVAAAAGVAAAKVAGKVAESGVAARALNKVRGEVVGLHGSPTKGLTEIKPIGPTEHAWAGNPLTGVQKATNIAKEYAVQNGRSGSLYVVKVPKKDLAAQSTNLAKSPTFGSPKSLKVVKEFNVLDSSQSNNIEKALKRAGFKTPKRK